MRRLVVLVLVVLVLVGVAAAPAVSASREPISGQIVFDGYTDGDVRVTPGGIVHEQGGTAETSFTGDISGTVIFSYKRVHAAADGSHLVSKGPFEGEVMWEGRTGVMSGMFTTECKLSCGGTMIGHGSGGLEGLKFQIKWGPGDWPFDYEGFALDPHGA
jgi:hypothetical protein